jgi:hypothetical protein
VFDAREGARLQNRSVAIIPLKSYDIPKIDDARIYGLGCSRDLATHPPSHFRRVVFWGVSHYV